MVNRLVQKYQDLLGKDKVTTIHGPMSPVLLTITWLCKSPENKMDLLCINKGRESFLVVSEKDYRGECIRGFREYIQGGVTLDELKTRYKNLKAETDTFYDRFIQMDLKKMSDQELESLAKATYDTFANLVSNTIYIEIFDQELLLEVLGVKGKEVIDQVWEQGTHPTFTSFDGRRLRAIVDFIRKGDIQNIQPIRYIYTDYVWPKSELEIRNIIENIDVDEKEKECVKLEHEVTESLEKYTVWKQGLNPLALQVVEYMQFVMETRDVRKDAIAKVQVAVADIATEMCIRAAIDPIHAPHIGLPQVLKGAGHLKSIKSTIESLGKGSISITYWDGRYEFELCDYDAAVKDFHSLNSEKGEVKELKGQIANKGKVTGKIKIIIDPHDDKGFVQGDILVTSMTRPEFVPLMKKAGAVVTNEGGITCHAAIVSRELKIPCIIGTKVATRTFKDGDLVEVDANTGVIRIL